MTQRGDRCPEWVTSQMLEDAAEHFLRVYPYEGVGFLTAAGFVPLENLSEHPEEAFEVADEAWLAHAPVLAVVHSHPHGLLRPSKADMAAQAASAVPWAIVTTDGRGVSAPLWFGDSLPVAPLMGRAFVHGVFDCYSTIRDLYRLGREALANDPDPHARIYDWPHGPVVLPDFPRDDAWWGTAEAPEGNADLYMRNFAKAGFTEVFVDRMRPQVEVGDVFLMKLGHPHAVNHGGVYVGQGLILHHVTGYTSHRAPLHLWAMKAHVWLRYTGPGATVARTED